MANMMIKSLWLLLAIFSIQWMEESVVLADEGEQSKGNEELSDHDNEVDQVALESEQENQSTAQKVLYHNNMPQMPSGVVPTRIKYFTGNNKGIPLALGQPFGPPPPPQSQLGYQGPPPPLSLPPQRLPSVHVPQSLPDLNVASSSTNEIWASPVQDMAKIISLDVKCEKNGMKVFVQFDKPFYGIVFSKGHYSNINCVHLPSGLGRTSATFDIGLHECGTSGNTENGLYGYGHDSGSGTYFENIIVIQYDPQVQEVWDQARKLRCTWHDQYEKSVTFRPFPVDMLDVVRADFAGDNVGCWMQIQVGKGPWASEVSGLVKIGQTMTMVLAIKDDDSKFDMLVRNCVAHDGKRAPIQLVDQRGCVTRPKLMSRFTKIKNFGASASVLSYAHFQAFKFPDSMEVHFQCTIQICRYQCPDQCSDPNLQEVHHLHVGPESQYGAPLPPLHMDTYHVASSIGKRRDERRVHRRVRSVTLTTDKTSTTTTTTVLSATAVNDSVESDPESEVGLNRIIKVVSSGDLTFAIDDNNNNTSRSNAATEALAAAAAGMPQTMIFAGRDDGLICMTTPGFAITIITLLIILLISCLLSAFLYVRLRPLTLMSKKERAVAFTNPQLSGVLPIIQISPSPTSLPTTTYNTLSKSRTHSHSHS